MEVESYCAVCIQCMDICFQAEKIMTSLAHLKLLSAPLSLGALLSATFLKLI